MTNRNNKSKRGIPIIFYVFWVINIWGDKLKA
jgi:hypothetical protein